MSRVQKLLRSKDRLVLSNTLFPFNSISSWDSHLESAVTHANYFNAVPLA